MPNNFFHFKQFTVWQDLAAMKVTTDGCLFGAWCAHELEKKNFCGSLLDVGTGTGLLSLMIAQQVNATIESIDIDKDSALQANTNFLASPWAERLQSKQIDVFELNLVKKWDVIVANPPFYKDDLTGMNPRRNAAHHNTRFSLDRFIVHVRNWLKPEGTLFLLLPEKRNTELNRFLIDAGLSIIKQIEVHQSKAHSVFRYMYQIVIGEALSNEKSRIFIKDCDNKYSEKFISLLKPFYLKL